MMILGHTFSNNQTSLNVFFTAGAQCVDQHISSSSISYEQTHGSWADNIELLSLQAKPFEAYVEHFALGIAKHVRDDNALPTLIHPLQTSLLDVTARVWELAAIPCLVNDRLSLKRLHRLQDCVASGLIEMLVADQDLVLLNEFTTLKSILQRKEIHLFLAGLWCTSDVNLERATKSFTAAIERLPLSSLELFVNHEIRTHWPRATVRYLFHHGMLDKRQAVHVRRKMDGNIDSLLGILHDARFLMIPVLQHFASARNN